MKTIYSLLVVFLLAACGCDRNAAPAGVTLPPRGTVRIVPQKTADGERQVQWKWKITAGTKMQEVFQPESDFLALYSSPEAGSHFWECELVVLEGLVQTVDKPGTVLPEAEPEPPGAAADGRGTTSVEADSSLSDFLVLWLRGDEYGSKYVTQEIRLRGVYVGGSSPSLGSSGGAMETPVNRLVKVMVVNETTVQIPAKVVLATLEYEDQDGPPVRRSISLDLRAGKEGE